MADETPVNTKDIIKTTEIEKWNHSHKIAWDISRILRGLGVEKRVYKEIYATLESKLEKSNVLGHKLRGISARQRLQPAFRETRDIYPDVFNKIPELWLEQCFLHMARRCIYNRNRRKPILCEKVSTRSIDVADETANVAEPGLQFRNVIIHVERKTPLQHLHRKPHITQCMPRDLVKDRGIAKTEIGIEDVAYECFVDILGEDIGYNTTFESIFYKPMGMERFEVSTQRAWRTALHEMLFAGHHRMAFTVDSMATTGEDGHTGPEKDATQPIAYCTSTARTSAVESGRRDAIDNVSTTVALAPTSTVPQRKRKEPPGKDTSRRPRKVR